MSTSTETRLESLAAGVADSERREAVRVLRALGALLLLCSVVWLAAFWIDREFYFIKPGSDIVATVKRTYIRRGNLLDMSRPVRVLVNGDSKVVSGFDPAQFEREVPDSSAFNCGIPNSLTSVTDLTMLLARGQVPTYVLYALEWEDETPTPKTFFRFTASDRAIMEQLFPFRQLLRNGTVFLLRSHNFGGIRNYYQFGQRTGQQMVKDKGYYFISDQSHFPEFRLPDDFRLQSDSSEAIEYRPSNRHSAAFRHLHRLAMQYGFKVLVVPYYYRKGEYGAPGVNQKLIDDLKPYPEIRVVGDEYVLLDNKYFSDTAHLNPAGAKIYTSLLAQLVRQQIELEGRANAF